MSTKCRPKVHALVSLLYNLQHPFLTPHKRTSLQAAVRVAHLLLSVLKLQHLPLVRVGEVPRAGLRVKVLDEPRRLQGLLHVAVVVEDAHAPAVGGHGLPEFIMVIVIFFAN